MFVLVSNVFKSLLALGIRDKFMTKQNSLNIYGSYSNNYTGHGLLLKSAICSTICVGFLDLEVMIGLGQVLGTEPW